MLRAYIETVGDPETPLRAESEIRTPIINIKTGEELVGVELFVYIDRIDPGAIPVELKTSSRSWSQMMAVQSLSYRK